MGREQTIKEDLKEAIAERNCKPELYLHKKVSDIPHSTSFQSIQKNVIVIQHAF